MPSQIRSSWLSVALVGLAWMSACNPETAADDENGGTGTDGITTATDTLGTEAGTADTTAGSTADTTVDTTADTTAGETGPAECGNGTVEAGEECDDGNLVAADGCSPTCQSESGMIPIPCNGTIYQCGDMIDNDEDGMIDLDDPECISPCDDNEASFQTDLPGQNNDCKADCYFDANSGGGDDKCEWNLMCDPLNSGAQVGCPYNPDLVCELSMPPECLDFCVPLVPNGCDCFGCCDIGGQYVYLDSSADCSMDNLGGCESCTFYENCGNPCVPEECELCFGQGPEDLPEGCDMPGCPDMFPPCLDDVDCIEGSWCQTGCCVPVDIG